MKPMIPINPYHKSLLQRALAIVQLHELGPDTDQSLRDLIIEIALATGADPEDVKLLQEPACYSK